MTITAETYFDLLVKLEQRRCLSCQGSGNDPDGCYYYNPALAHILSCPDCHGTGLSSVASAVQLPPSNVWTHHGVTNTNMQRRLSAALPLFVRAVRALSGYTGHADTVLAEALFILDELPKRSKQFQRNYLTAGTRDHTTKLPKPVTLDLDEPIGRHSLWTSKTASNEGGAAMGLDKYLLLPPDANKSKPKRKLKPKRKPNPAKPRRKRMRST